MKRRQFIAYMTTASGLLPIVLTQIACETSTGPSSGSSDSYNFTSSTDAGHSHTVKIKTIDVSQPPISSRSHTTSGSSHTHTLVLSPTDFNQLANGQEIVKATPVNIKYQLQETLVP